MNLTGAPRGSFFALLLIIAGALLFLDNLGVLPIQDVRAYWPIWIILFGVHIFDRTRSVVGTIWAFALVASGILLILGNLQIIRITGNIVWPVMLIALGAMMLIRPVNADEWRTRMRQAAAERRNRQFSREGRVSVPQSFSGNELNESMVFSSLNRRVETQQFEGGKLEAVFGSIEVDLSEAAISSPDRQAELELNAVFGGIEITVPRTWKVILKSTAVFGGCVDQTVPPRPEAGYPPTTLLITGAAVFGGITIRN